MRVIASIYAIHSHMRGNHEASGKRSGFPDPHRGGLSNNDVISSDQDRYYAVFLLLVYRLAPRTFRLRI